MDINENPDKNIDQKQKRCKKGTRKNAKGDCVPIETKRKTLKKIQDPEPMIETTTNVLVEPEIEKERISIPERNTPLPKSDIPDVIEPVITKDGKTRRCPNGYRMNNTTGFCEKIKTRKTQKKKSDKQPIAIVPLDVDLISDTTKEMDENIVETIREEKEIEKQENIQQEMEQSDIIPANFSSRKNNFLLKKEKEEYDENTSNENDTTLDFLYPTLNDPFFNLKIARRKEFYQTRYDGTIYPIEKQANILCNAEFELLPHQLFVKNFLSFQTPYNSLLLYHGLGSGKTCSAIGIAEEMRQYMKQVGIKQRIIVVASPNVQGNFRLQLFDERKLKKIGNPGEEVWNIDSCIGNSLLKEINPSGLRGITRDKVISQINTLINQYYVFMGYGQMVNFIQSKIEVSENSKYSEKEKNEIEIKNIRRFFNSRLIIIDEFHNIRLTEDNKKKKAAYLLMKLAKHTDNMRLLLLSATPMFNSYKEIIWIVNLMNLNDKRATIEISDVFDKDGNFKEGKLLENGSKTEGGKELLSRKINGYISYVRGENPYTFPFRVYPNMFDSEHTFQLLKYPTIQMNGKPIEEPIKQLKLFVNNMSGEYQKSAYVSYMNNLRKRSFIATTNLGQIREMPSFENMESFGYTLLQGPLEALNIVYPNPELDTVLSSPPLYDNEEEIREVENILSKSVGSNGLLTNIKYNTSTKPFPIRYDFEYKKESVKKYGSIFSPENISKYSSKISSICESILNSTGIVLIYSQYIDGGILPIALALEEMGFSRYCSNNAFNKNLFKTKRTEPVDAITLKTRSETVAEGGIFQPAKYILITGDKSISPSNTADIKQATNTENRYGEKVKVIFVSKAGSEGLDFKYIRQIHILEPWYNMNRIEQIIGRGVRNLSHCGLPFEERNVEIYLHTTQLENEEEEPADLYVYRLAEKKAFQIGKITRLLKENAVDCILNIGQTNFSVEKLMSLVENQQVKIQLSSGKTIDFKIGDQPFTDICDYMDTCEYKCSPRPLTEIQDNQIIHTTYSTDYLKMNNTRIVEKIKSLFREQHFYQRNVLINAINIVKQYPIEHIYYALTYLIKNKNEFLVDKYGRSGHLLNKGEYYLFQPIEITDENASLLERSMPIEYKRDAISLEIPSTFSIEKPKETAVPENKTVVDSTVSSVDTTEHIFEKIRKKFLIVFSKEPAVISTGEKNWYKHANLVMEHLRNVHKIPTDTLQKYVIYHIMDMMLLNDKLALIQYFYTGKITPTPKNETDALMLKTIQEYLGERLMSSGGRVAVLLNKENGWKLFVKPDEEEPVKDKEEAWNEGEPEDYKLFEKEIDRFDVEDDEINDIVGFTNMFKDREMVFRIKNVVQSRNNKGAVCGNSTTKADVVKLTNQLLKTNVYDVKSEFFNFGMCVIIEMLMRYYTEIKKNGKVYYLNPEQTAINDIVRYSRGSEQFS
jgi:superfamily II DNA or RNA helicase